MRTYDADDAILEPLRGSGIELNIVITNGYLECLAKEPNKAYEWVLNHIYKYPDVDLKYISVSKEVNPASSVSAVYAPYVLPAMRNVLQRSLPIWVREPGQGHHHRRHGHPRSLVPAREHRVPRRGEAVHEADCGVYGENRGEGVSPEKSRASCLQVSILEACARDRTRLLDGSEVLELCRRGCCMRRLNVVGMSRVVSGGKFAQPRKVRDTATILKSL
ncbi:hypothetical protein SASPL_150175 [Salvia splendens]|uniref:Glucan endo-1,3-beta-D-glucosidase n=1 Tax=Salvia splendens TaxID=180675 RepID=A0A8X8W697_SALSN|nr:hypothetical protein SASPL_150175 [Salvia splendens]